MTRSETDSFFRKHRLLIVCGPGGVGKTTLAAALALKAAVEGQRVLVLTIDPAKRLADALGLKGLDNEAKQIRWEGLKSGGTLSALMLDPKETFDQIVRRYAQNDEVRDRIFKNPIYQKLSNMIAGSQEFMAMEKVYELSQDQKYDLLVLDTPPTQHALDFLEAPEKMVEAVTNRIIKWLLKPSLLIGGTGLSLFEKGARRILQVFDRMTGIEFLQDLSQMLLSTAGLLEGFKERAEKVASLITEKETAFFLVSSTQENSLSETSELYEAIKERKLFVDKVLVNRVYLAKNPEMDVPELYEKIRQSDFDPKEKNILNQMTEAYYQLIEQDQKAVAHLQKILPKSVGLVKIPRFEIDIHDLEGLYRVSESFDANPR